MQIWHCVISMSFHSTKNEQNRKNNRDQYEKIDFNLKISHIPLKFQVFSIRKYVQIDQFKENMVNGIENSWGSC